MTTAHEYNSPPRRTNPISLSLFPLLELIMAEELKILVICVDNKEFKPVTGVFRLKVNATGDVDDMMEALKIKSPNLREVSTGHIVFLKIRTPVDYDDDELDEPATNVEAQQPTRRTRSSGLTLDSILEHLRRENQGKSAPSLTNNYVVQVKTRKKKLGNIFSNDYRRQLQAIVVHPIASG